MRLRPCKYCGKEPEMAFRPLPYLHGCWHVECRNEDCEKKPGTWYYYSSKDAIAEWDELMREADE